MQLSLGLDEYVVFDFETTGLSPWGGDEIVEVAAMKIFGDSIDETRVFQTFVNPKRLISPEATRINGITNEMVADAPTADQVIPRFLEFVGDAYLVAQNARFDMSFLTKYLVQLQIKRSLEVYDTMIFSRRCYPDESSHNLDVICRRLQIPIVEAERHRSLGDVKLTARAFLLLKERLGERLPNRERFSV